MTEKNEHTERASAGVGRLPKDAEAGRHSNDPAERYRTPDEELKKKIERQVKQDDTLDMSGIEISVNDGRVTLTGAVDSVHTMDLAVRLANEVNDVVEVENHLELRRSGAPR